MAMMDVMDMDMMDMDIDGDGNSSTVGLLPTESPVNPDWAWMAATCRCLRCRSQLFSIKSLFQQN